MDLCIEVCVWVDDLIYLDLVVKQKTPLVNAKKLIFQAAGILQPLTKGVLRNTSRYSPYPYHKPDYFFQRIVKNASI